MRPIFLAALLLGSSALAQTRAEVEKWPVLYEANEYESYDGQEYKPAFTAQEVTSLQQLIWNIDSRPELREYRRTLPDWARKNLTLDNVLFSAVAPYRSAQPERLTIFVVANVWSSDRLLVLSNSEGNSAWLMTGIDTNLPWKSYTLHDINSDGRKELAYEHGFIDGTAGVIQYFSLLDWQRGELGLRYQTMVYHSPGSQEELVEKATIHVRRGPQPQLVSVMTRDEYAWDEGMGQLVIAKAQVTLHPLKTPVKGSHFKATPLW